MASYKIAGNKRALEIAPDLDAVCFGSLAQRSPISRKTILRFLARTSNKGLKIFDINTINTRANQVAAYVCSQTGAMPDIPEFL